MCVRDLISEDKIMRFRSEGGSWEEATTAYLVAVANAARLYPPLHLLEVWFRNRVHYAIGHIVQDPAWITAASRDPSAFADSHLKGIVREQGAEKRREAQKIIDGEEVEPKDFTYRNTLSGFQAQVRNALERSVKTAKTQSRVVREGDLLANLELAFG